MKEISVDENHPKNDGTNQTKAQNPGMNIPWERKVKIDEFSCLHFFESLTGEWLLAIHQSFKSTILQ